MLCVRILHRCKNSGLNINLSGFSFTGKCRSHHHHQLIVQNSKLWHLRSGRYQYGVSTVNQERNYQNLPPNNHDNKRKDVDPTEVSSKEVLHLLSENLWPKDNWKGKFRLVLSMSFLAASKGCTLAVPFVFKYVVNTLNDPEMDFSKTSESFLSMDTASSVVIWGLVGFGALRIASSVFQEMRNAVFTHVSQSSMKRVAVDVFTSLHKTDRTFITNHNSAGLSDDISRGTKGMEVGLRLLAMNIIPSFLEVSFVAGVLSYKCGAPFALATIGTIFLYVTATYKITTWRTKFYQQKNRLDKATIIKASESLDNYDTVKYFQNEKHELNEYSKLWTKYMEASFKTQTSLATLNAVQNIIFTSGLTMMLIMTAQQIMQAGLTVGDLVMVQGLLIQLSTQLNFVGSTYREIKQSYIDIANMTRLKKKLSSVESGSGMFQLQVSPRHSSIEFDNVHFGYESQAKVLNGVSFTVPPGKKAAIVGSSGSGKSTIINLLFRFYEPLQGNIKINSQNIKDVDVDSLRKAIGIVPQKPGFFNKDVFYNIHYGDLTKSEAEVMDAARKAALSVDILDDMDRNMGEKGEKLSSGQQQRVAISRVILRDPVITLYDEATASQDTVTEKAIMSNLKGLTSERTSILIAHRLSTVIDCDIIFVLDKGRIVEQGTHYELLSNKDGIYTNLWNQSKSPEDIAENIEE